MKTRKLYPLSLTFSILLSCSTGLYAQSELPIEKGTVLSITTPSGVCTGELVGSSAGFITLQERDRSAVTFIPMSSAGIIRVEQRGGVEPGEFEPREDDPRFRDMGQRAPANEGRFDIAALDSSRRIRMDVESFSERSLLPNDVASSVDRSQQFIFGKPEVTEAGKFRFTPNNTIGTVDGYAEYTKGAFTIGHFERFSVPAWVAMKWTKVDLESNLHFDRDDFDFETDFDVPSYARSPTSLLHSTFGYERGHMARNRDLYAFGFDATEEGFLMSNIVPQQQPGHATWGQLENEHRKIVGRRSDIEELWVVSGPIFENNQAMEVINNQNRSVSAPHATYKVIGWFTDDDEFHCRAYIIDQEDDIDRPDLSLAIRTVDRVEELTGLNFFPDLPAEQARVLESQAHSKLWDDAPIQPGTEGVSIDAILPNPFGSDRNNEFIRLRNTSDDRVQLIGWKFENSNGDEFDLSRFFVRRHNVFEIRLRNTDFFMRNSGDTIRLIDDDVEVVDFIQYDADDVTVGQVIEN